MAIRIVKDFGVSKSIAKSLPLFVWIIIFTSFTSLIGFLISYFFPEAIPYIYLSPDNILKGQALWTLVTHLFFHANFFHLFVNMLSLFFIGNFVEGLLGKKRFFWFYIVAGLVGGLMFVFVAPLGELTGAKNFFGELAQIGVGASGALFGLLGILAVIIPKKRIYLLVGPIVIILAQLFLGIFLEGQLFGFFNTILEVLLLLSIISLFLPFKSLKVLAMPLQLSMWVAPIVAILPLMALSFFFPLPIGNWAHLGGLFAGLVYGFYLRFKFPKKVSLIGRYIR